jgi:hypothetical protein
MPCFHKNKPISILTTFICLLVLSHNAPTMAKTINLLSLLLLSLFAVAQSDPGEGAQLLFKNSATKLTAAEKSTLYKQLGFLLSADNKQFIADKDGADFPFEAQVFPTDLNKDGAEEIFIVYGNSYTSGNTGSSVVLFIKNTSGAYQMNLGFPGMAPEALATASKGYPDLVIGGPGFEFPVWRWNGKAYALYKKMGDAEYGKAKKTDVETLSKAYTATLPK